MKAIKQTYSVNSSLEEVWKGLTDPKYIEGWGGGPAIMDAKVGTEFSLWGGSIWGKNIEVLPESKLVQEWWSEKKWKEPSVVTFTLKVIKAGVEVNLHHKKVPEAEFADIRDGWKDYYMGPMKKFLEEMVF